MDRIYFSVHGTNDAYIYDRFSFDDCQQILETRRFAFGQWIQIHIPPTAPLLLLDLEEDIHNGKMTPENRHEYMKSLVHNLHLLLKEYYDSKLIDYRIYNNSRQTVSSYRVSFALFVYLKCGVQAWSEISKVFIERLNRIIEVDNAHRTSFAIGGSRQYAADKMETKCVRDQNSPTTTRIEGYLDNSNFLSPQDINLNNPVDHFLKPRYETHGRPILQTKNFMDFLRACFGDKNMSDFKLSPTLYRELIAFDPLPNLSNENICPVVQDYARLMGLHLTDFCTLTINACNRSNFKTTSLGVEYLMTTREIFFGRFGLAFHEVQYVSGSHAIVSSSGNMTMGYTVYNESRNCTILESSHMGLKTFPYVYAGPTHYMASYVYFHSTKACEELIGYHARTNKLIHTNHPYTLLIPLAALNMVEDDCE